MARIEYALPSAAHPKDQSRSGVYRPGINVVDFDAGYRQARIWSEHNLRSYQWRFDYLDSTVDEVVLGAGDREFDVLPLAGGDL